LATATYGKRLRNGKLFHKFDKRLVFFLRTLFSGSFGSTGVGQMAGQDFFSHLVPFITAWVSWVKGSMPIKINKNR
jgi:hypothetical protein